MKKMKQILRSAIAYALALTVFMGSVVTSDFGNVQANAAQIEAAELTVDLDPAKNTGEIIHGASGFLYGVSSENVPTTNTVVPLKSKILVTKGAVGTEHPYGDALDVAKTFLESGGQQVQMYNSNYYGVFGVTATVEQYCEDLKKYIAPAVVEWKKAWKKEHGTPEAPKDNIGAQIDIDKAIVYVPINETTPHADPNVEGELNTSWKAYRDAIKSVDENAALAGPNDWGYIKEERYKSFVQYCADNNCMPDVITWHELETVQLQNMSQHMRSFQKIWNEMTDWTKYNAANHTTGIPEIPQICINEYAEMAYCGVPGRLVNWMARLEDEKITGCLPFWHQANNLNDLAAGANEGNGAWWLYKWYGDMSGNTQPVSSSTAYDLLYGVSAMDETKKISTTLLGGFSGDVTVKLNNVNETKTFAEASKVHVKVQETMFTGFHGAANEPPVILEGAYSVDADGSVTIKIPNTLFENAYHVTLTQANEDESLSLPLSGSSGIVYEAENAALSGTAKATNAQSNPSYYMSNDGVSGNRAADMQDGAVLTYTVNVPADGKYKFDFAYGNGQGTERNDMNTHNPVNLKQTFSLDGGEAQTVTMESTLFQTMTGIKTLYYDLTAGEHTVTVTTPEGTGASEGLLLHDFVRVSFVGVYNVDLPLFNKVYEAEMSDVNRLLKNSNPTVSTQTELDGYSGGGYVTGLSGKKVTEGGGIRTTVVVEESGLYNISLRYQSGAVGKANIYVENTAITLDRLNKTVDLAEGNGWQTVTASIYLQKGINVVDVDMTVDAALDYMRVQELPTQDHSTTIEAENAIPDEVKESVKTVESEGASGGKYVTGMKGSYSNPDYLEFKYNASAAGKYQMQVFHSNEDLAGSHWYNIKAIDKYAVVEVNQESDSPRFILKEKNKIYYFVDCGDHDPSTLSAGDEFGEYNSVTDRMYGTDEKAGYKWGLVTGDDREQETPGVGGIVSSENDKAVYTNFQKALSNSAVDLVDGQAKEKTFRYAHGQDSNGINPRYVSYQFELDPGKYSVTVCMGSIWEAKNVSTVTLSADGVDSAAKEYEVAQGGNVKQSMEIDLTGASKNSDGKVELLVKATSTHPSLQMNYITIREPEADADQYFILPPVGERTLKEDLPEEIYAGELEDGMDWFIDYRNLKNKSDRYFFINTFSDDTFREKTITLDLKQGENTIRIYNDNSWNVTYGGTTGTPGTTNLLNYTPNFDKFVITPMALDQPEELAVTHSITINATEGGIVTADKNSVADNASYTLTMVPKEGCTVTSLLINGREKKAEIQTSGDQYSLMVTNVTEDQDIRVYFAKPGVSKDKLQELYNEYKDLENIKYSAASWKAFDTARTNAKHILANAAVAEYRIAEAYDDLTKTFNELVDISDLMYFVDCGDHEPGTLSVGDDFGKYNSVTDRLYGEDQKEGYSWGLVMEDEREELTPGQGSWQQNVEGDNAVYTTYQKARSEGNETFVDGQPKTATFRYSHSQDQADIDPRYVSYAFELDPGAYSVTVGMSNIWDNAGSPTVTASADGAVSASADYTVPKNKIVEKTMKISLAKAKTNADGRVKLSVRATSADPTIQMCYIYVKSIEDTDLPVPSDPTPLDPTEKKVTDITVTGDTAELKKGGTVTLKANVEPSDAKNQDVKWSSSDTKVAVVSGTGVVTAIGKGTATITAAAMDGSGVTGTYQITVTDDTINPSEIKVTKITVTGDTAELKKGRTVTLKANVEPSDAKNQAVEWSSSDTKVAVVSGTGVVTAIGKGTVTITAAAMDGSGVTGTYQITVTDDTINPSEIKVTKITVTGDTAELKKGRTVTLKANVEPSDAKNQAVEWSSSDTKVAVVSDTGVVTAVGKGTATITATAADGSGVTGTYRITVTDSAAEGNPPQVNPPQENHQVEKITLRSDSKKIAAGKKVKITAQVQVTGSTANKKLNWTTSNKKYATVNSSGMVSTKKAGAGKTVTITAKAEDGSGKKASIKIKVLKHAVKKITLKSSKKTVVAGKKVTIKATVKTTGKTANKDLQWTTSNKKYATVNSKGVVTTKKAGKGKTVTIKAASLDGTNKKASIKIKIK